MKTRSGFSQVEVLLAFTALSVLALMAARFFGTVGRGMVNVRGQAAVDSLAAARMNAMGKNPDSHKICANKVPVPGAPSGHFYDEENYPAEAVSVAGRPGLLYSMVVNVSSPTPTGEVVETGNLYTGYRRIAVTVVCTINGQTRVGAADAVFKTKEYSPLYSSKGILSGVVRSTSGFPVEGATVRYGGTQVIRTGADGRFKGTMRTSEDIAITHPHYTSLLKRVQVSPGLDETEVDFTLVAAEYGRIRGTVWQADHPVISQVVGRHFHGGIEYEWVEIFGIPHTIYNPISTLLGLRYGRGAGAPVVVSITYISPKLDNGGVSYLFANRSPVVMPDGSSKAADAVWSATTNLIMTDADGPGEAGCLQLYYKTSGAAADTVGWVGPGGVVPGCFEGTPVPDAGAPGFDAESQLCRRSSTGAVVASLAPQYDTDKNDVNLDFLSPITVFPRNHASGSFPGGYGYSRPAPGTWVTAEDEYSPYAQATLVTAPTGESWAEFDIPGVQPGSHALMVFSMDLPRSGNGSSGKYFVPPGGTVEGVRANLNMDSQAGFVYGHVSTLDGNPVPFVPVSGNSTKRADANGAYRVHTSGSLNVFSSANHEGFSATLPAGTGRPTPAVYDINLVGRATVVVQVVGEDGQSPYLPRTPGCNLRLRVPSVGPAVYSPDEQSIYEIRAPVGAHSASIMPAGACDVQSFPPALDFSISPSQAGQLVSAGVIQAIVRRNDISGIVRLNGSPFPDGALVFFSTYAIAAGLYPPPPSVYNATLIKNYGTVTGLDGRYEISAVDPGLYYGAAWVTTYVNLVPSVQRFNAAPVNVTGGGSYEVNFD